MQLVAVVARRADYPEIGKVRLQLEATSKGGAHPGTPTWWRAAPRQSKGGTTVRRSCIVVRTGAGTASRICDNRSAKTGVKAFLEALSFAQEFPTRYPQPESRF